MRILQVHTAYREAGGEDVAVATEAAVLRDAGHEVHQLVVDNPTAPAATARALLAAPWSTGAARRLRADVAVSDPDVAAVHNTWFAQSPSVVAALGRAGVPVVMTLHNYRLLCPAGTLFHHGRRCHDCVGSHPWHALAHRCYRDSVALSGLAAATVESWRRSGALDAVARFVVMTEAGRELFVRGGLPADRIVVRPHGVADPGGPPARPAASDVLLYVGRAVEEKGLGALLRWWGRRPRRLRLDVIGDGPLLHRLRGEVPEGVSLLGERPREAVWDAMRAARALVVPSLWDEPFGLVAAEAMACGVGVASTGVGGLADIHGHDGGWVAGLAEDGGSLDEPAWDVLLEGLGDEAVEAAGRAARERYEARFTLQRASSALVGVYEDVATRR